MKLTLIGTSHGAPEPNRKCSCTMVEVGQRIYFFDMGTSGIEPLVDRGIPVSAVQSIFITHMHGDHTNGLVLFMDLISWYYKDARPEIFLPKAEAATLMESWLLFNATGKMKDVNFHTVQPGVLFDDGFLKVTAIRTKHCDISYAYLLEAEGKAVLLTGDLNRPGVDFPGVEKPLDLIICESAHFEATEYLPIFEKMDIKKVCVTHYSPRFLPSVLALLPQLKEKGIEAVLGTDDLEFRV